MDLFIRRVRLWPRSSGRAPGRRRDPRRAHRRDQRCGRAPGRPADGRVGRRRRRHPRAGLRRRARGISTPPASGCRFDRTRAEPGLLGLIENDRRNWRHEELDVAGRATFTLAATVAAGAVHVRSHAQVDADARLERLEGVLAARAALADRCRVQVVAFPQSGIVRDPPTADLLDAAIASGADLIGGIDPCGFDRDPVVSSRCRVRNRGTAPGRRRHPSPRDRRARRVHTRVDRRAHRRARDAGQRHREPRVRARRPSTPRNRLHRSNFSPTTTSR